MLHTYFQDKHNPFYWKLGLFDNFFKAFLDYDIDETKCNGRDNSVDALD